jgi:hypothetical protein
LIVIVARDDQNTFIPDYSVKALTDVSYLKIRSAQYLAARRATLLLLKCQDAAGGADNNGSSRELDDNHMMLDSELEKVQYIQCLFT